MSIVPLLIIHVSLIFLNNSWNHSTDKSKSQFFASCVYLSSKYGIILMKYYPLAFGVGQYFHLWGNNFQLSPQTSVTICIVYCVLYIMYFVILWEQGLPSINSTVQVGCWLDKDWRVPACLVRKNGKRSLKLWAYAYWNKCMKDCRCYACKSISRIDSLLWT